MTTNPIIEVKDLQKSFGELEVLKGINTEVQRGEVVVVIGPSGSGKSTFLRCLNRLETPDSGKILLDGVDLTDPAADLNRQRMKMGMVFQQFNLFNHLTVLENITLAPMLAKKEPREQAEAHARELLERVGLLERESAMPRQLSGGQKQRVAIARALATNPKVLLCDEATSALDPTTTQSILALIKQLNRTLGVTVLVITHEMRVVEQICTRVAIISESRISEIGAVEEVFRRPKTDAARKLLFPQGGHTEPFRMGGPLYRIVFDGSSADRPVGADMILRCGTPVNIAFADTKIIDGRIYGQMLLQFPEDEAATAHMLAYLDGESIGYEEVR